MIDTMHICLDCGKEFMGCKAARFCYDCRRRRTGESAKKRRLCDIGARAKWRKAHEDGGQTVCASTAKDGEG